jgi:transcriptional regulator with XRE-family HTH domain
MRAYAGTPVLLPALATAIAVGGYTRTQVGAMVGVSGQYVSQVIRGHASPSASLRARLAEALGIPEADLFAERTG